MKRLAILLLLLATTTQAFVARTHVHANLAAQSAAQGLSLENADVDSQQLPTGGDHGGCLLCQIATHGAAALASQVSHTAQLAFLYVVAAHRYAPEPGSLPLSHAWSSRGPPRS